MKYRFTRTRMVAGLAVALTWVGQPAAWADCYDSGFNDGLAQCRGYISQDQCNSQYNGYITQQQCDSQKSGLFTQQQCDSQKSGLLSQGECDSKYNGYITQGSCDSQKSGLFTQQQCDSQKSGLFTQQQCDSQKSGLLSQGECDSQYSGYITQSSCNTEKKTISDQLSSCQTEKGGLISQNACNAQYAGKIDKSVCETEKTTEVAQYTGYVENGVAKSCKEAPQDTLPDECKTPANMKGYKEGYKEGTTVAGATATTEVAKYTGYVENGVAKSCKEAPQDTLPDECKTPANMKGYKEGYEKGKAAGATETTADVVKYTGYVVNGVATPCTEVTPDPNAAADSKEKQCADKLGFTAGYNARDTFCENNPEHCIQAYLQGFYKFFVKRRLPKKADNDVKDDVVKDFAAKFPDTLLVLSQGGPSKIEIADQWRYTWKKTKASNCEGIQNNDWKSGERAKQLKDGLATCLIEEDDKGVKGDGSSADTGDLAPNQSLGYTVYLMEADIDGQGKPKLDSNGEPVMVPKATMEIIFSPNQ